MTTHAVVYVGFILLPVVMALLIASAARSWRLTASIVAWMLVTALLAWSGVLSRFSAIPPPIGLLFLAGFVATFVLGHSRWVGRLVDLPLSALIVAHSFRILVELLIHSSSRIGLAPPQMTWDGYNFDIVTGVTALALAPFAQRLPKSVIVVWNCLGLALLINVVGIAILSFPTPFQRMHPNNTWVASFPYIWLPAVLVTTALLGHILLFRKLAARAHHS